MEQCVLFYEPKEGDPTPWIADTHGHDQFSWSDVQWALDNRPGIIVSVTMTTLSLDKCHRGE